MVSCFLFDVVDPVSYVEDDEQDGEGGPRISINLIDVADDGHSLPQRQRCSPSEFRQNLAATAAGQRRGTTPLGGLRLPCRRRGRGRGRRGRGAAAVVVVAGCGRRGIELVEQVEPTVPQSDDGRCRRHTLRLMMRRRKTWTRSVTVVDGMALSEVHIR